LTAPAPGQQWQAEAGSNRGEYMEDLMNTLLLGAVVAAVFPIAFLMARLCLVGLVRTLPAKAGSRK
jgi:hypothetical protein